MKNLRWPFLSALLLILSLKALAEGGEAHAEGLDEHTIKTIAYQCLNVGVLVAGLIYFLRQPTKEFFKNKRQQFVATAEKATELRRQAEQERMQIQVSLSKLESTADESLARARAEAADMKKSMIADAENLSKRLREEAGSAARLEVEKAKTHLREQLIKEATQMASKQLGEKLSSDEQKKLQNEFIDHIQVVRP